jgi:hypothetical protein
VIYAAGGAIGGGVADPGDPAHRGELRHGGPGGRCHARRAAGEQGTLLKRLPTLAEVADTAAFVASDRAGAMTATVVNLSAGSFAD